jgi:hypothetical protein
VRLTEPLAFDGALDDPVYQEVPAVTGLIQVEPVAGVPASERTEAWIFFDDDHVYISARCWDSAPESQWVMNEMRRDNQAVFQNENVTVLLDTFHDRRNAVYLLATPLGARYDGQVTNEQDFNADWNPVWDVQTGRFDGGWTLEMAIPFTSLRYRPGRTQVWGVQIRRMIRWKNEVAFLTPIPAARGVGGVFLVSLSATLVGIEAPEQGRTLELKPFAITDLTTDRTATPPVSNDLSGDIGIDVKYAVTQNLSADFTVNTDFAQVEADEQQVNLTRFSLFFPEKREFFLENQGTFSFGGSGAGPFGGSRDTPVIFYSRQIGLAQGREVPLVAGGRLTGRLGAFSVGALNIQTDGEPVSGARSTNFSVVRVKRDLLRRSSIGAIVTRRSQSTRSSGSNETYGLDGTFAFYDNVSVNTYWAKTRTRGFEDDVSYRANFDYRGDRYGAEVERLVVGTGFNPEVGFLRRDDFERSFGSVRFSPRPRSVAAIRKVSYSAQLDYITDRAGVLETREAQGRLGIEFENSDTVDVTYTRSYELLTEPFPIAPDVTIPIGGYGFQDVRATFMLGQQRLVSGRLLARHGSFFSGNRTSLGFTGGRVKVTTQLSVEPGVSIDWIDLREGRFTTQLVTARTTYTFTPRMFLSALVQVNSSNDSLGGNIRLRWEYQPGSELFVVYNEQRDTLDRGYPDLENRAFVIKINRLFRF